MNKLCSGDLRHYIIIESPNETKDDIGGINPNTFVQFADAWAQVKPIKGYERLNSQKLQSTLTHTVTLRYIPGITAKMRINFNGRMFNIRDVINEDERNEWSILSCEEGAGT